MTKNRGKALVFVKVRNLQARLEVLLYSFISHRQPVKTFLAKTSGSHFCNCFKSFTAKDHNDFSEGRNNSQPRPGSEILGSYWISS